MPPPPPGLMGGPPTAMGQIGMPPMVGNPRMLGLGGMMGIPTPGSLSPGDPIADPNQNPALGPMTNGGPEPDEATLEQLIQMLKVMGAGGAASGMPSGPGGMGLPEQVPPGGAIATGTPEAPHPPGAGLMGGQPNPMMAPQVNPLLAALGGPPR